MTMRKTSTTLDTRGKRIRWARLEKGWTQADLAEAMGRDESLVGKWENDVAVPREMEKLAAVLGVQSPAWLAFGTETLDHLSADAIELALRFDSLSEDQQALLKNLLEQLRSV